VVVAFYCGCEAEVGGRRLGCRRSLPVVVRAGLRAITRNVSSYFDLKKVVGW